MWRVIGATFFVFAFSTGTSFFTLPFTVTHAGFWPSVVAVFVSWIFLIVTGFYYLEATLTLPPGANIYSITRKYYGNKAVIFNVAMFLIVYYGYVLICFSFGIPMLISLLNYWEVENSVPISYIGFALLMFISVAISIRWTIFVNVILVLLLGLVFYLCFRSGLVGYQPEALGHFTTGYLFIVIPSLLNSLYYQTMLPTLAHFLKYDAKKVAWSTVIGVTGACLLFIAWLWLVITSTGKASFGDINWFSPETVSFDTFSKVEFIGVWLPYLFLLILTTSSIGAGAIMVDFLSDLFQIPANSRRGYKRFLLTLLTFGPPFLVALIPTQMISQFFLYLTDVGGLYLCGLMPIWWIWTIRYYYMEKTKYLVPGGKVTLAISTSTACFVLYLVGLEFLYQALT